MIEMIASLIIKTKILYMGHNEGHCDTTVKAQLTL